MQIIVAIAFFCGFIAATVGLSAALLIYSKRAATATPGVIARWLDAHASPEWRIVYRLHSVQISIFWAVLGALWVALPAFQSFVTPVQFALIAIGFSLAILFARLTKQSGLPDV